MKNKLIILAALTLLIGACSKNENTNPLLIPPNFNQVPDLNNPEQAPEQSSDQDLQELKDLLLKN
ncbi:MAG: hypothetical protein ACJAZX_000757 [Rickettsiales bacterium]|jgi:hypothetical protein